MTRVAERRTSIALGLLLPGLAFSGAAVAVLAFHQIADATPEAVPRPPLASPAAATGSSVTDRAAVDIEQIIRREYQEWMVSDDDDEPAVEVQTVP